MDKTSNSQGLSEICVEDLGFRMMSPLHKKDEEEEKITILETMRSEDEMTSVMLSDDDWKKKHYFIDDDTDTTLDHLLFESDDDLTPLILTDASNKHISYRFVSRLGRGRFAIVDKFERLFSGKKRQRKMKKKKKESSDEFTHKKSPIIESDHSTSDVSESTDHSELNHHNSTDRTTNSNMVALKRMDIFNGEIESHMIKERDVLFELNHPNIIRSLNSFVTAGLDEFVIILPIYDCTLSQVIKDYRLPLPIDYFQSISYQLLSGLAYLHKQGIIHRDIKSNNILLNTHNTHVVITDFGVSKILSPLELNMIQRERNRLIKLLMSNNSKSETSSVVSGGGISGADDSASSGLSYTSSSSSSSSTISEVDDKTSSKSSSERIKILLPSECSDAETIVQTDSSSSVLTKISSSMTTPNLCSASISQSTVDINSEASVLGVSSTVSSGISSSSDESCSFDYRSKRHFTPQMVIACNRAPELLLGCRIYDFAIDIWACACVLSRLVRFNGEIIFDEDTDIKVLTRMRETLGGDFFLNGIGVFEYFSGTFGNGLKTDRKKLLPGLINEPNAIDLLDSMLVFHPCQRQTAVNALQSPFFRDYTKKALNLVDMNDVKHSDDRVNDELLFLK